MAENYAKTHQTNFNTFYSSMITLLSAATGAGWNEFMHDTMRKKGWVAALYWIIFVTVNIHILLNIVTAVIFERLEERARMTQVAKSCTGFIETLDDFVEKW